MTRDELIAALADAEGGSREFSDEMLLACGKTIPLGKKRPHPTRSLDDAVALVPNGAEISLTNLYGVAHAEVGLNFEEGPKHGRHEGGNLKLALCIAILKSLDFPSDPE